ncbi:hypothetical protein QOZ80_8AG0617750 [Eleusine coracana subsp. coracana]|nr:hypothetical protein QOZ80_8AG0617750 [Eleusine coracana subsp. coracana]
MSSSLLAAAAAGSLPLSRAASGVVARAARGFQVFRIDGYSLTNHLPCVERISSRPFTVGGRGWFLDYYPNGTAAAADAASSSPSISLFLRLSCQHLHDKERVRACYKFSLLDAAGNAAYELPADTGVFLCGVDEFVTKEELERRRDSLLVDDRLVVRCDVAVVQMEPVHVAPNESSRKHHHDGGGYDEYYTDWEDGAPRESRPSRRWKPPPMDDAEYVRRCLLANKTGWRR